jgi:Leucine-rich repeat (LRR) protein
MIERIENLSSLRFLKKLDMSANRIRVISGLKGLYSLEELNLSGNKIVSLANLS